MFKTHRSFFFPNYVHCSIGVRTSCTFRAFLSVELTCFVTYVLLRPRQHSLSFSTARRNRQEAIIKPSRAVPEFGLGSSRDWLLSVIFFMLSDKSNIVKVLFLPSIDASFFFWHWQLTSFSSTPTERHLVYPVILCRRPTCVTMGMPRLTFLFGCISDLTYANRLKSLHFFLTDFQKQTQNDWVKHFFFQ